MSVKHQQFYQIPSTCVLTVDSKREVIRSQTPSLFWSHERNREAVRRYEELSEIFSDKDNYSQSRVLLKGVSGQ
jgi:hypothetical protein